MKIDLDMDADLAEAGRQDDLSLTVDYKKVRDRIEAVVSPSRFYLIEALAEKVAQVCLEEPGVQRVRVRVEKPGALRAARTVGVEILRVRESGLGDQGSTRPPSGEKPG